MVATLPSFLGVVEHRASVVVIATVPPRAAVAPAVSRWHIPGAPADARPAVAPGARLPAPSGCGWPPGWQGPAVRRHFLPIPTRRAPAAIGRLRSRGPVRLAPA